MSKRIPKFKVGDFYQDCFHHPCLCVEVEDDGDSLWGISLIDGSGPRGCSISHCGVVKLTVKQTIKMRLDYKPEWDDEKVNKTIKKLLRGKTTVDDIRAGFDKTGYLGRPTHDQFLEQLLLCIAGRPACVEHSVVKKIIYDLLRHKI